MGATVRTVLGDISPSTITGALLHEHMLLTDTQKDAAKADKAVRRKLLADFSKLAGFECNCFVDTSLSLGPGCQPALACELSRKSGMHIILSTGFYVDNALPSWVKQAKVSTIADFMCRDLTEGVQETDCCAGIIKTASNAYGVEKHEEKVFIAAAKAHKNTGAPITVHSPKGALPQLKLLQNNGVPPERISFAHIEVGPWADTLQVAQEGAMFVFTNFGGRDWVPEDAIIAQIADLVRRGHARQIMISVDMYLSWTNGRLRQRWPGGYLQVFERVIPKLRAAGLTEKHINTIIRTNPRRYLAF